MTETAKATAAALVYLASSPSRLQDVKAARAPNGSVEVSWTPSPEIGVHEYIVGVGSNLEDIRERTRVRRARAILTGVQTGAVIGVKAVNARGLEGWDWGRGAIK